MQDRLAIANQAAESDEPVLLTGEPGTGKELLARAIHAASARRTNSFVTISCGEEPPKAFESALVGNEFGASAEDEPRQSGAWQRARSGTLLIDGIDHMPLAAQAMLLKVLTNDRISAANRTRSCPSIVRLICTTSRDLKPMVESGAFLKDLHNRISILTIEIPPLGRRREDIPLLISHFLEQAVEPGGQKKIYSPKAIELLATSDWPGNVRQLFDLVKHNIALSIGKVMTEDFVQRYLTTRAVKIPTYEEAREEFERDYLERSLKRTAGNVAQAARLAKRNRTDFYKLLARYRLDPGDFKNVRPE
jgi:two-component system response regulator GlrR